MWLMTASLLNSWKYLLAYGDMDDFMRVLRREPSPKTEAQAKGDEFEAWAYQNLPEMMVGTHQIALKKQVGDFLLYGRLDNLHAGVIYDTKYTGRYEVGKYRGSPQTSMYFEITPGSYKFEYIISDGKELYRETYYPDDVEPIMNIINDFIEWLKANNLLEVYQRYWLALN